jgi:uncharacterized membrane protein YidH (DUF202 family)
VSSVRAFYSALPVILIVIGMLQLVLGLGEIYQNQVSIGMGEPIPAQRWFLMSAYIRVVADAFWTIGFAAVVAAAAAYLETMHEAGRGYSA